MLHFASPLFDTHPRFIQLKSLLLSLFNGEAIESIALAGIEHIISVQLGPLPTSSASDAATPLPGSVGDDPALFPPILIRTYTLSLKSSSTRVPYIELEPMGPSLDLVLRRHLQPDPVLLAASLKKPKLTKKDVESGLGDKKKMRNKEIDEMGDLRGRVHVGKQDLSKLQGRKVKALKKGLEKMELDEEVEDDVDEEMQDAEESPSRKRRRKE